jgi:alkylhydroperoxidase family enzyme
LCSKGSLMAARGDHAEAERLLRLGLQRMREVGYTLFHAFFLGELGAALGAAGRVGDAVVETDAALRLAAEAGTLWCMPELLRIKGELLGEDELLGQALDMAHRQGGLAWELRAALSLARQWTKRGRTVEGRDLVKQVLRNFSEGFDTADVHAARKMVDG